MNVGCKSSHLCEPAHLAGSAQLKQPLSVNTEIADYAIAVKETVVHK